MSSEEPSSYSDTPSNGSNGDFVISGNGSNGTLEPPRSMSKSQTWGILRSESFFLALLFALVALLLPTFFSFATTPSKSDGTELPEYPLKTLIPYIPTITTVFRVSLSTLQIVLRPFTSGISLLLALLAPIFLAVKLLYKTIVVLPSRIIAEVARFLYPIYLFCSVACLFGAGIGLGGRLVVEGIKLLFIHDDTISRKGRRKIRNP